MINSPCKVVSWILKETCHGKIVRQIQFVLHIIIIMDGCNLIAFPFVQLLGSGSLSSPMREHRNFAQFYCISVTNFSSLWMYPLGNYMIKKNVFFAFLWLFICLHAMYLEKSPVDFLREVFAVCHAVRDMNENSRCVYPLSDKVIRVVHSNMWYHWIGNWMPIPVV